MTDNAVQAKADAVEAYNSIVASAQLDDIRLITSSSSVKPEYYVARLQEKDLSHSFNMKISNPAYDEEIGILIAQMEWVVSAKQGRKTHLKITAEYLVAYSHVPPVELVHMQAFIERVGRFATYPYFRSLVSQISWASQADLPILPVLK